MLVGLQAGFGSSLAAEFAGIASYGFALVRQDLYAQHDPAIVPQLIAEWVGAPVTPLFLVGGGSIAYPDGSRIEPHELAAMTASVIEDATVAGLTDYALEIGNEPDIACEGYSEHPDEFAEAIRQCLEAAETNGFQGPFITGGIANLNNRGFRYLHALLRAPSMPLSDVVIGFHRYPEAGRAMLAPHDQFLSRTDEWHALQAIVGARPVACTEFGYHTAAATPLTLSNDDVADAVLWDLNFFEERAALCAIVYQLNDGPTDTWIDRYGVRALDGTWKVVAERIRDAYGP